MPSTDSISVPNNIDEKGRTKKRRIIIFLTHPLELVLRFSRLEKLLQQILIETVCKSAKGNLTSGELACRGTDVQRVEPRDLLLGAVQHVHGFLGL